MYMLSVWKCIDRLRWFKTAFFPCLPYPQLIGITDGYLSLLQDSGEVREDLKMPEGDLGKEIESKYDAGEEILVNVFDCCTTHIFVRVFSVTLVGLIACFVCFSDQCPVCNE